MSCSNCFSGCTEIVSDKCVKYTGADIAALGITQGDTLASVEEALATYLASVLTGVGITIDIDEADYCEVVSQYLPVGPTFTALDVFTALVKAACDLQEQVDAIETQLTTLNADYTIGCLTGVVASSDTHLIVQAVIDKLCDVDSDLTALALDLETNYVKIADLNGYIAEYLESTAGATRYSSRMVPYAIVPYYGSLGVFDATGAGIAGTEWEDIYLCNGSNGTPDIRGRAIVGAIAGVPGGALASAVNPGSSAFNPNYSLGTVTGANSITLTESEIPSHNHTLTDPGHTHVLAVDEVSSAGILSADNHMAHAYTPGADGGYELQNAVGTPDAGQVAEADTGITLGAAGGGAAHSNIQPVIATYFIMYIP